MKMENVWRLKGYLSILESAPPNGRYNHNRINKISALRLYLELDLEPTYEVETLIKELIRKLYEV